MTDLSLSVRIYADAVRYAAGLADGVVKTKRWGTAIKAEVAAVRDAFGGVTGQLTALAGGITAVSVAADSAKLDKALAGIKLNAGSSRQEVNALRADFFRMAKDSGRSVEDIKQGFGNLVAMGQSWQAARAEIDATNIAMAVTSANADKLTSALGVASEAYHIDLAQPGQALALLDKMTVAGRKGNAELENLSDIFARVGVNAANAGMGFDKTLAFIETLSLVERQPERLATLADSTLRLFNNQSYRKEAEKATGVKFFDAKGSRRDALAVMADLKKQFDKLKTDAQRDSFMNKAFGKADLDTLKGMRILLSGDSLSKANSFTDDIAKASGTLKREMPEAISNAVDQTGRLKAALREAADGFAQPINETLQQAIKWGMDSKESGGLALSGQDMLLGGAGLAVGTLLAARYGGKAIGALLGKGTDLATGVATGKALQEAAGVQSVYVVNMPGSGIAGGAEDAAATAAAAGAATSLGTKIKTGLAMAGGLPLKDFVKLGPAALGTTAAGVTVAGAAGYGIGTGIYKAAEGTKVGDVIVDVVGGGLTRLMAALGNEDAQRTMAMVNRIKDTEIKGTVSVTVQTAPGVQASVTSQPANRNTTLPVGRTMDGVR
ncbi:phage tail tape measure protein [Gulbenkiania mobilis]|uniref:phage tail tape measure protein n=1 Tax=Gulbenkiania mobilis TaxID=397457 RepID=UPI0006BBC596|nr:phage tail tape measure protein [Gulbenkiania mobilis]